MAYAATPAIDRVLPRLIPQPNGCWLWPGAVTYRDGYGLVGITINGRPTTRTVHRVVWEGLRGPIPEGMEIDHLCRTRLCANPDHLEVVTHAENQRRMAGNVRPNGHPRTAETSGLNSNGRLVCKICHRAAVRQHRACKKAARTDASGT